MDVCDSETRGATFGEHLRATVSVAELRAKPRKSHNMLGVIADFAWLTVMPRLSRVSTARRQWKAAWAGELDHRSQSSIYRITEIPFRRRFCSTGLSSSSRKIADSLQPIGRP